MKTITIVNEATNTRKEFSQNEITIGRSIDRDFTTSPDDQDISRHHCTIIQDERSIVLKDTSKNGTIMGKLELKKNKTAPISNGDIIIIGKCTLKVLIDEDNGNYKLTPIDGDDDFSDSALGLSGPDEKNSKEQLPIPSSKDIERDILRIDKKTSKRKK